jgi:Bax inhibitor 1
MSSSPIDTFSSLFSSRTFDVAALLKSNDISVPVQQHLKGVYGALALGVLSTALGSWFSISYGFMVPIWMSIIGILALTMWLPSTRHDGSSPEKRLAIWCGLTFLKGCSLAELVAVILDFDPSILLSALLYTAATFACFSGFALVSKRRSQLYLGGILGSALSWLAIGGLMNLFFRSSMIFNVQLFGGLFVFIGYVIVDTQMVVERASQGSMDYLTDALHLYTNLVAIFVRIAIILMRNSQRKQERKDNKRR